MRPAFSSIKVNQRTLTIRGPIDLDARERTEAYFWVRVTKGETAEAIGIDEMDEHQAAAAVKAAAAPTASPGAGAVGGGASPMWQATIRIKEGTFATGDRVRIEAWALVRTKNPTRTFHVYWEEPRFTIRAS
jgi:hypothetical protein